MATPPMRRRRQLYGLLKPGNEKLLPPAIPTDVTPATCSGPLPGGDIQPAANTPPVESQVYSLGDPPLDESILVLICSICVPPSAGSH